MFKRLSLSLGTLSSLTPSRSPSPYPIFGAQCSTSSPLHHPHPHLHSHPDPKVLVCWDLDDCTVPPSVTASRVVQGIATALKSKGINGPIKIRAFADDMLKVVSHTAKWELDRSGAELNDVSREVSRGAELKEVSRVSIDSELESWASKCSPPAHILFIGGSSQVLHSLRDRKYNILLMCKEPVPAALCRVATIRWNWDALVLGENSVATKRWNWDALVRRENLTVTHFNQPPHDSWYGHYEGPLKNHPTEIETPAFAPDDQPVELLQPELFSQVPFRRELQAFLKRDAGSFVLTQSRTRECLAFCLKEYGPPDLRSITKSDGLLLVNKLINELWVKETPHLVRPFKRGDKLGEEVREELGEKLGD